MRIVITATSFCEYVIGQANGLADRGNTVLIVLPGKLIDATVGEAFAQLLKNGVESFRYDVSGRRDIRFYFKLWKRISKFDPDIIHFHENGELETLSIVLRFFRTPSLLTVHDILSHPGRDSRQALRRRMIRKILRQFSGGIHVHGVFLQQKLKGLKKKWFKKSLVIPHGTLDVFLHWQRSLHGKEPLTCLFFGRMEKYKGLDNLIKIGERLKNRNPDIKIIVAGKGAELTRYRNKLDDSEIFEIHEKFIPNRDIPQLFSRASLLLLPYQEASQSGIAVMGLVFGVPIVANAVGSIPDLISYGIQGALVPPGDNDAFADAVLTLLENPSLQNRYTTESLKLAQNLSFRNLAPKFEKAYVKMIDKRNPADK